jgi:hypothetical protein
MVKAKESLEKVFPATLKKTRHPILFCTKTDNYYLAP